MFTGLVAERGTLTACDRNSEGAVLAVRADLAKELALGDSVAVNGVCLTAKAVSGNAFTADAMAETLRRSSLGRLVTGDPVNLELPLRLSDRLGGHLVLGHVDTVGKLHGIETEGESRRLTVSVPGNGLRYVVEKGSITLDGVSLTVAAVGEDFLTVALIPETLARTNLGSKQVGDLINIEFDVLAKHVEKLIPGADE